MTKLEVAIAGVIGRELFPWTPPYKPKVIWPTDFTPQERKQISVAVYGIVGLLKDRGIDLKDSPRSE